MPIRGLWRTWFLEERPSCTLGLFRIALAATVGLHVIPTLLQMQDNYLAGSFRELNGSFFTAPILEWVYRQPDAVVWAAAAVFGASWFAFLIGLFTQASGAALMAACYFFYARNSLHIGTLSWDILLVTFFLMVLTPYGGDSFSVDSVLRGEPAPFARTRPVFLLRLLQMQLAATFFYTGLNKITADGNWFTDNPYWYLMNAPAAGVMKDFPLRPWLAAHPQACYALGAACVALELSMPVWLWWRRTRAWAVAGGCLFHVHLLMSMHVPTIFFFLFPPQFLLFLDPELLADRLQRRRAARAAGVRDRLIFDGACGFCRAVVARLAALDYGGRLESVDFRSRDVASLDPALTLEVCHSRMHLLEADGRLSAGFHACRRLALRLPGLWWLAPLLYLPGSAWFGERAYAWVATNRFRLHFGEACRDNACSTEEV